MKYPSKIEKISGNKLTINTYEPINLERLKTLYGSLNNAEPVLIFEDKRKVTTKQRALFFALVHNCSDWFGYDEIVMENFFKVEYLKKYRKLISLSDNSIDSRTDVNNLLNLVVDFVLEWKVPFKKGYELLPRKEQWYLFQCCKHRTCAICGKHADIHHAINLVGMGNNRGTVNHLLSYFIALCREHHNEIHNLGLTDFSKKYHGIKPIKLDDETLIRLNLMSVKQVREIKENEE